MDTRDVRRQNFHLLAKGFRWKKDFAAKLKTSPSQVSQWFSGYRQIEEDSARKIERAMRKPTHWMDTPQVDAHPALDEKPPADPGAHQSGMDQVLSYRAATVAPTFSWEQLMLTKPEELPVELQVVLRDDAMAPLAPAGVTVKFTTSRSAAPGDAVLVRDQAGELYFREYRARLGGAWEAHATNRAYPSLQSAEHGLQVVAVFNGIETSWSALQR